MSFVDLPPDSPVGLLIEQHAEPIAMAVRAGLRRWPLRELLVVISSDDGETLSTMCMPKADIAKVWGPLVKEPWKTICERVAKPTRDPDNAVWVMVITPSIQATASVQVVPVAAEGHA